MKRLLIGTLALLPLFTLAASTIALAAEARVTLHDGKLATADLSRALLESFHVKGVELDLGSIDLRGLNGTSFVQALDTAMGDGCNVAVRDDALVLHLEAAKLPKSINGIKQAIRTFTAVESPEATAKQQRSYGLLLPKRVDPNGKVVVLVHGLDCNRANWYPMAELLVEQGYQVAYFTYPSDGPLEESSTLFTKDMKALRENFPAVETDVVAHSMGGLVARRYIEGDAYAGGVKHLILLGTPNLGSSWATYRLALEMQEHWNLWRNDPDWHWTWAITDGLGEAGSDLKPTSEFLKTLNARPRRDGVAYTIVAGNKHPVYPMAANALASVEKIIPEKAEHWWGFRQTESALERGADKLRNHQAQSDGPVSLKSTRLAGVDDYVVVPCDHASLNEPCEGNYPGAWNVIRDRLAR